MRLMIAIDLDGADHIGRSFGMAAVQDATQSLVVLYETVSLVDQKCRVLLFNVTEEGGRRDVAGQFRARRQVLQQDQNAGLAAACARSRADAQHRHSDASANSR